jgi:hypothetical protein
VNPSGIDGGQFLLQALGNPDIFMRIADEYMDIAEIFFDFLAFQNTCVGHRDPPQTRPDPLSFRAQRRACLI